MLSSRSVAVIEGALAGIRMAAKAGECRGDFGILQLLREEHTEI